MTTTTSATVRSGAGGDAPRPDLVTCTIDGTQLQVPKGTLVIRAAEQVGIQIPRFCDHPLLAPAGACRQCLVDVATPGPDGSLRAMPKPQASCTLEVSNGMVVSTQHTSPVADKAQQGVMELLLINHPLDCPVCDKGGECPLQNQAMSNGRATSRFIDAKRTFPKPIKISTEVLLDRDRCILCQRCTRFSKEIAGDAFIDLQMRGIRQQIGVFDESVLGFGPPALPEDDVVGPGGDPGAAAGLLSGPRGEATLDTSGRPFASYFAGNTIQICPVGALTSAAYRFRARPFDLVSSPAIAEHDSCGSAIRVDHRRGVVVRRLAGEDPAVNEEWITDKDRFAYAWQSAPDRLTLPLVRDEQTHELVTTSWSEALDIAARGLRAAAERGVGLLPGGRLTLEDAYAWSKFARVALGTNDIDFRARAHSVEEAAFLAARVAGAGLEVTFADLERAPFVLLVGFEPEEEAGTVFLRLRKGVLAGRVRVAAVAPFASGGTAKLRAELVAAAPGTEAEVLDSIRPRSGSRTGDPVADQLADLATSLGQPGALVLVGERLAAVRGALSAAERLLSRTGARLAWVPRRAGDRGAVEVGALPNLLPGGRSVSDHAARAEVAAVWGVSALPDTNGHDAAGILASAADGRLGGLVVGGVDLEDLPDPAFAEVALLGAAFVVQLEVRSSSVTPYADVVFPVAPPVEKAGTFLTWEGRPRPFGQALASRALTDARVLDALATALDAPIGVSTLESVHAELRRLGRWAGPRPAAPDVVGGGPASPGHRQAVLATWKLMLDSGRGQDGEAHLAGTARRPVARLSPGTALAVGAVDGEPITVTGPAGWITLPVALTSMPDHVIWLPQHSPGSWVNRGLGVGAGAVVSLSVPSAEVTR
jgi:NADH-quinone oxidoreductase subunit G